MSFSPVKVWKTPPLDATLFCKVAMMEPALAAAFTASSSILPFTTLENRTIFPPKDTSCLPNSAMSFSPVKTLNTPPIPCIFCCISDNILPAEAAAFTDVSSIFPATLVEKLTIASAN